VPPPWRQILDRLAAGNLKDVAAIALEALERVDRSRERSCRSLNGQVAYDLRIGARVTTQACLALCQRTSRFGADQAATKVLSEAQAKVRMQKAEIQRL